MISIIMPTYNRSNTIARAIKSVIKQTFEDWELLIIDDNSTDNTMIIIHQFIEKYNNIRCIKNTNKKGPSGQRNRGINNSKGDYIAFLDSDDEWLPNHLSESYYYLKLHKRHLCSSLWYEFYSGNIKKIEEDNWYNGIFNSMMNDLNIDRNDKIWIFNDDFFEYIIDTDFYCYHINTIVVSRHALKIVGGFKEKYNASEDLEFILRLIEKFNLITINSYHFIYYYGIDNIYATQERCNINYNDSIKYDDILNNSKLVDNFSMNLKNKMIVYLDIKKIILISPKIKNKKQCLIKVKGKIFKRCLSLVYLNKKLFSKKSMFYLIKSFFYITNFNDLKDIFILLFNKKRFNNLIID